MRLHFLIAALCLLSAACSTVPDQKALPTAAVPHLKRASLIVDLGQRSIQTGKEDYWYLPFRRAFEFSFGLLGASAPGERRSNSNEVRDDSRGRSSIRASGGNDLYLLAGVMVVGASIGLVYGTVESAYDGVQHVLSGFALTPAERSLRQVEVNEDVRDAFAREMRVLPWVQPDRIEVFADAEHSRVIEARFAESQDDAMLVVRYSYAMSSDLDQFIVIADAYLFPGSPALQGMQRVTYRGFRDDGALRTDPRNALYHRTFRHVGVLPMKPADRDAAIRGWTANDGERLRRTMNEASVSLARQIAGDLPQRY